MKISDLMQIEIHKMVKTAVVNAKHHGINLTHGKPNPGRGDCAFEATIYNINERPCYAEKFPMSIDYYRRIFVTDMANRTVDTAWNTYSRKEWLEGWKAMLEPEIYERGIFGDLILPGIACGVRKYLLIFNTNHNSPPIYVVDPRAFNVVPDSDIPLVLAYNMSHYESMHPCSQDDEQLTINLVNDFLAGTYIFQGKDINFLLAQPIERKPIEETNNGHQELIAKSNPKKRRLI